MRKYLATLHKRSDTHKKHFALGVSSSTTLLIFGIWFAANFGAPDVPVVTQQANVHEAGPLESLGSSLGSAWEALTGSFGGLSDTLGEVDVQGGYEELKVETLQKYYAQ